MKHQRRDKEEISIYNSLVWLGRVAIADGVLSRREAEVITAFGDYYGIDVTDFLDVIEQEAATMEKEVKLIEETKQPHDAGKEFEDHVISRLLGRKFFRLLSRASDTMREERTKKPDLYVQLNSGIFGHRFWIECKWSSYFSLSIKKSQLRRYILPQVRGVAPVFFVFGLGGTPANPHRLYLFSLEEILKGDLTAETRDKERIFIKREKLPYFEIRAKSFVEQLRKYM